MRHHRQFTELALGKVDQRRPVRITRAVSVGLGETVEELKMIRHGLLWSREEITLRHGLQKRRDLLWWCQGVQSATKLIFPASESGFTLLLDRFTGLEAFESA